MPYANLKEALKANRHASYAKNIDLCGQRTTRASIAAIKIPQTLTEMFTDLDNLQKHATDSTRTKPFYLFEYAHAMFKAMGSVDTYNELFDKNPSLIGGAIWEWQDQGIYYNRNPDHPIKRKILTSQVFS